MKLGYRKLPLSCVVIFSLIIYGFSAFGTDMRYPFLVIAFFYLCVKSKEFCVPKSILNILIFLLGSSLYSMIVAVLNSTGDYFETLRFCRCIITCIIIAVFVRCYRLQPTQALRLIEIILFLNAVVILITVLLPDTKPMFQVINQYTKSYSRWRAIGLLNGEDAAGFFCNLGMIIETIIRIYNKKKLISWKVIVYVVATIFTSRMAILFLVAILVIDFVIACRRREYESAFGIVMVLLPIGLVGGILWIITTNVALGLRETVYNAFPFLRTLYSELTVGYLDYGEYSGAVSRHFSLEGLDFFQIIFGAGYRTGLRRDIGYIKTIYSIGVVGVIAELSFYIRSMNLVNIKRFDDEYTYIRVIYGIFVLLLILWEMKNSFIFSNGVFELYILLFFSITFQKFTLQSD
ncbi:hypothetical protein [Claveliimonas bilis]|uniref:hypothetical protein n=1 Tax=Claveliimonas bilis TaxID=3028070 RepID=UPI00292D1321|nr:hypothetical protein [Claveliimonas bilis]